jgi:GNAT superfamily N-acetyltransferase
MSLVWRVADDPDVVHRLIEASDQQAAARTGTVAPLRRRESTRLLVEARVVRIGLLDRDPVVTVTVGPFPSFDPAEGNLPEAPDPWYMLRLAVAPESQDFLAGFHAVRHAVETARAGGAGALRAEANPDLAAVLQMLTVVGFVRYGTDESRPLRRTFLQMPL